MIISSKFKFAFIHNPKVAGTSIRHSIEGYHDYPQRFWHQAWSDEAQRVVDAAHIPFADLPDGAKAALTKCFTFGFVRDPMNRFWASLAEFRRQHGEWSVARLPADGLLQSWLTPANVRHDWRFTHFCPQHYFFYEGNKCRADFVGNHENFDYGWTQIQQLVGIKFDPLDNKRHRVDQGQEPLSVEGYTAFMKLYAKDYLLFGYDKLDFDPDVNYEGQPLLHHDRVEMLHSSLSLDELLVSKMNLGEKVAYLERRVAHYKSCCDILEKNVSTAYQLSGDQ